MPHLPADATLDQAPALGGTRNPTLAHPDCTCRTIEACGDDRHPSALILGVALCRPCRATCRQHGKQQ